MPRRLRRDLRSDAWGNPKVIKGRTININRRNHNHALVLNNWEYSMQYSQSQTEFRLTSSKWRPRSDPKQTLLSGGLKRRCTCIWQLIPKTTLYLFPHEAAVSSYLVLSWVHHILVLTELLCSYGVMIPVSSLSMFARNVALWSQLLDCRLCFWYSVGCARVDWRGRTWHFAWLSTWRFTSKLLSWIGWVLACTFDGLFRTDARSSIGSFLVCYHRVSRLFTGWCVIPEQQEPVQLSGRLI
jgi:hypothetical protein